MNDDWRSRNTMKGSDALKAAAAVLGLLFAFIMAGWIVTRLLRPAPPAAPTATETQK